MNTPSRMDLLRIPPHSLDAEQAVLGGLMLDPQRIDAVATILSEGDFYRSGHRAIFRAMMDLSGRGVPCDAVTLGDWFENNGLAEIIGGSNYVVEVANSTASAANVSAHAAIVREKAVRRMVIDQATQLIEAAYGNDEDAPLLLDRGIGGLMSLQKVEAKTEFTLRQAMTMAYEDAQKAKALGGRIPGIPSGLMDLDRILGGWHDSDLTIIGARPSQGKTALLMNLAIACGVPCGIISAEQPARQLGARIMSIKSKVPAERLRNGRFDVDDLRRLEWAVAELIERKAMIYDRSGPTIADVQRIARKWKKEHGIKILFADYLQRIKAVQTDRRANKSEKVGEVAQGLKDLARDLEIPVVSLAQVRREAEGRQPGMDDLSDSSEIEKEADQIITEFRPGTASDNVADDHAVLDVCKNRHGPTGAITVKWFPETMRFENYAHG